MESNVQPTEAQVTDTQQTSNINTEPAGLLTPAQTSTTDQPWQEWIDVAVGFLARLTEEVGNFFSDYKKPLLNLLLLLSVAVSVYITLAVLDAINNIPLLAPVFELVGLGYGVWFTWRYLWQASTRKELWAELDAVKAQVFGEKIQDT